MKKIKSSGEFTRFLDELEGRKVVVNVETKGAKNSEDLEDQLEKEMLLER